ncbi:hypothetical protein DPMN_179523 [Dreissena polymorpha]|uniref:Uncharacterized protein n=1 Tax=Dreissena polymorpha TaxID=45954 RepID=A0A9D4IKU8_DREPO|nr:hypothetical protein DPMN_179523 [Dreissena polymorpha]
MYSMRISRDDFRTFTSECEIGFGQLMRTTRYVVLPTLPEAHLAFACKCSDIVAGNSHGI